MIGSVILPSRRSPPIGLPRAVGFAGEVEQVVDELEHDAEVEAVLAQRELALFAGLAEHAADLRAAAEQIRRLAADDLEVLVLGDVDDAVLGELIELALDHAQRDVAQQPHDIERVLRQRHRHRLDVEEVAGEHGDVVAPARVHRLLPAPHSASSMMSSWTSVAVWMNSTTAALRMARGPE